MLRLRSCVRLPRIARAHAPTASSVGSERSPALRVAPRVSYGAIARPCPLLWVQASGLLVCFVFARAFISCDLPAPAHRRRRRLTRAQPRSLRRISRLVRCDRILCSGLIGSPKLGGMAIRDEARSLSTSESPLPARGTTQSRLDVTQLHLSASVKHAGSGTCRPAVLQSSEPAGPRTFRLVVLQGRDPALVANRRGWHPRGGSALPIKKFKRRPNTYRRWHSRDSHRRSFVHSTTTADRAARFGADAHRKRDLARRRTLMERPSSRRWHSRGAFSSATGAFKQRPATCRRWDSCDSYQRFFVRSATTGDCGFRLLEPTHVAHGTSHVGVL